MEAKVRHHGEIAIVSITGPLEIEYTQPFHETCQKHFLAKKLIFNMANTSFVGSTGIQPFLETIKLFSELNVNGLKLVGVKSEFKRIFMNLEIKNLEIHETEDAAISSFDRPPVAIAVAVAPLVDDLSIAESEATTEVLVVPEALPTVNEAA